MDMAPEPAYVLNRRPYKESSLIVDLFSSNYGRICVIANSALKGKKGISAMLQVCQPLLITWTGRSSLKTLTSIEAPSPALALQSKRLFSAYYINELVLKLVPQSQGESAHYDSQACFIYFAKTLNDLSQANDIERCLRSFEYQLLSSLGVFPDITKDVNGADINVNLRYEYRHLDGFHASTRSASPLLINGQYLREFDHILDDDFEFTRSSMKQMKFFIRALINHLLGGQTLKSRALFKAYKPYRSAK